jgi:hypothetical protein
MALQTTLSNLTVNAQADAMARLLDDGSIKIYTGVKPANADTAITSQVLLASCSLSATSAPAAVAGVLTFNAITPDAAADNTGTATWFRAYRADGTTAVMDGNVGTVGSVSNLELATVAIVANAVISITSLTHTVAKATTGL